METSTGALIALVIAQIVSIVTMILKNNSEAKRVKDLAAIEAERIKGLATIEVEREKRHRAWQVEDRDNLAKEVKVASSALATKVEETSRVLATKVEGVEAVNREARSVILGLMQTHSTELAANTKISTDAFHEANNVKQLLADEVKVRNELSQKRARRATDSVSGDEGAEPPRQRQADSVAATQELAEQTGHAAEATAKLAEEIGVLGVAAAAVAGGAVPSVPAIPVAELDPGTLAARQLAVATSQLLVEVADRAKTLSQQAEVIQEHTGDTAESLRTVTKAVVDRIKEKP